MPVRTLRRTLIAGGATLACLAAPTAAEAVVIQPAETRQMLFIAGDIGRLADAENDADRILERTLQQLYRQNARLAPATAKTAIAELVPVAEHANDGRPPSEGQVSNADDLRILAALATATKNDPVTGPAVRAVVEDALENDADGGVGDSGIKASIDRQPTLERTTFAPRDILADTLDLAAQTPAFGTARDLLWEEEADQSVSDPISELKEDRDLVEARAITDLILSDGTLSLTEDQALSIADVAMDRGGAANDQARGGLRLIVDQEEAVRLASDARRAEEEARLRQIRAAVKEDAEQREAVIKNARAVLTGAVTLLEYIDPEVAETVGSIGSAVMQGAEFFNTLADSAGSIAVNLATGNYFGVVMDVFGLAGGLEGMFGPDPAKVANDKIIKQLDQLADDLAEFREDMSERLDRIDTALNTIYSTLNTRLDELEVKLVNLSGDVKGIFDDLIITQGKLDQLEQRLYGAISDLGNRDLTTNVRTALGWRERTGSAMPSTQFQIFAGMFSSWTTSSAYDDVALVPEPRSYTDDDKLLSELDHAMDRNSEFFRKLPQTRFGLAPLGTEKLPNPRDWAVSARAYSQLLLENPEYMTDGMNAWLTDAQRGGLRLRDAYAAIAKADVATGTKSRLFNGLLGLYRAKATDLENAIIAVEDQYKSEQKGSDGSPLGLDFWGAASQTPDVEPPIDKECQQDLELVPNLQAPVMLPREVRNAWRLGLGDIQICAGASMQDDGQSGGEDLRRAAGQTISYYWKINASLTARYKPKGASEWTVISRRSIVGARETKCQTTFGWEGQITKTTCDGTYPSAASKLKGSWGTYRNSLSSATLNTEWSALPSIHVAIMGALRSRQTALYNRVLDAFNAPSSGVSRAAVRLTGAKKLLDSYVQLGMPTAWEEDGDLHGLLAGRDRLLDQDAQQRLTTLYIGGRNKLPAANYRAEFMKLIGDRAAAVEPLIARNIGTTSTGRRAAAGANPVSPIIESTLSRIALTRYILTGPRPGKDPGEGPGGDPGKDPGQQPAGETPPPAAGGATPVPPAPAPAAPVAPTTPRGSTAPSTAPAQKLTITGVTGTARKGLTVRVSGKRAVSVRVLLDARTAKRLRLGKVVGRGKGTGKIVVKLSAKAAKKLRGVKVTVQATAGGATAKRTVTVR